MPKQPKPKAPKLSKEQIAAQMAKVTEANRFKTIVRESLYPIIQRAGSIAQGQTVCEVLKTVMMSKCNAYWADKTVLDLGLLEELQSEEDVKDLDIYIDAITLLNGMSITDAQKLVEGMNGILNGHTQRLAHEKQLSDIQIDEIVNPIQPVK